MDGDSFEMIERQIAGVGVPDVPEELRAAVLGDVQRELRAARWDRRLARAAVLLLVVGVSVNVLLALPTYRGDTAKQVAFAGVRGSLVDAAAIVADVTDAATARAYARQLAAMRGDPLKASEAAAIDTAIEHHAEHDVRRGNG